MLDLLINQYVFPMPIPEFNELGYLPPGVHEATWAEFLARFGINSQRLRLATGLAAALRKLGISGCRRVIIGGCALPAARWFLK